MQSADIFFRSHLFKNFSQFVVIHTVKGFSVVSETEVYVFLEFPCFLYDLCDLCHLLQYTYTYIYICNTLYVIYIYMYI